MIGVVMYHYVRDPKNTDFPHVHGLSISDFESQIRYLVANYEIISPERLPTLMQTRRGDKKKQILLTFDDGYLDHFQNVLPILAKYKLSGIFFPVVMAARDRRLLDVNKIHCLLSVDPDAHKILSRMEALIEARHEEFGLRAVSEYRNEFFSTNRWDSAERSYVKRLLQFALPSNFRALALNQLCKVMLPAPEEDIAHTFYMGERELRKLIDAGMFIGGHSHHHIWLNRADEQTIERELESSMTFLREIHSGSDFLKFFCYPYGGYDTRVLSATARAGYDFGFCIDSGWWSGIDNRLAIPRFDTNDFYPMADSQPG